MRCRVCGCTDERACAGGCSWVDGDICSGCFRVAEALREWMESANRASWAALRREVMPPRAHSVGGGE